MADEKVTSNGNVTVWVVPEADIADYLSPTATEINTNGLDVTEAVAWEGTTFPANTESNDVDDRSLRDRGNSTTRGFAQFEAVLSLFRPLPSDTTSVAAQAWALLKEPRLSVYLITRVLQAPEGEHKDAAAGEWISVYRMDSDTVNDDTEGEDSYKFIVSFLPQGELSVYTQVKNATPPTVTVADAALSVGDVTVARATLGGKRATQVVTWLSSDATVATVSPNGVITALSTGTTNITASHPAASAASTASVVTVS